MQVTEIFRSIQGESTYAGLPCIFVRLTGCNLRCVWCDTAYAFYGGKKMSGEEVLAAVRALSRRDSQRLVSLVELTGGEPLLQRQTPDLVHTLNQAGYQVSIETHGEVSIAQVANFSRIVMDIKTPSSKMNRGGFRKNLKYLKPSDEVKFVIASDSDYHWAKEIVLGGEIPVREILFSPAMPALGSPGSPPPGVTPLWLAEKILEDRLPVRLQLQLHKQIWGPERRGV